MTLHRRLLTIFMLCATAPSAWASSPDKREVTRFAIVIGNNQPENPDEGTLRFADDDAVATYRLLLQAGVNARLLARFDDDTAALNPDLEPHGAPTLAALFAALESLNRLMQEQRSHGKQTELLLFYSGHGDVAYGEGYVVLEDARLTRTVLLERILGKSAANRNHVVVDACKSYYLAFQKGPGGQHEHYGTGFSAEPDATTTANTGFVLSTSSDHDSHEWGRYQAGVFSYEVRSGLRGGADADRDGIVSYAELGAFLSTANRAIENPRFRPDFIVQPPGGPRGELSHGLLEWSRGQASLEVDSADLGHFYVETASGIRVADIHAARGQTLDLYLPTERPLFVRSHDEATEYEVDVSTLTALSRLRSQSPLVARRGALHVAFSKLFVYPFGADDVRAYQSQRSRGQGPPESVTAPNMSAAPPGARGSRAWTAVGWTAIGCAGLGLFANVWAYAVRSGGDNLSQAKRISTNSTIRKINIFAVVSYSVAGAAAASWLGMKIWRRKHPRSSLRFESPPEADGMVLSFETVW